MHTQTGRHKGIQARRQAHTGRQIGRLAGMQADQASQAGSQAGAVSVLRQCSGHFK